MKTLFLLRGLPGSGKSTLAKKFGNNHIEADMYFIDPETKEYKYDPSKIKLAHQWCQLITENYMNNNQDVIVTNTFTTEQELAPYYDLAVKYGYTVVCLIVENRHNGQNIHNVPEEVLNKMESRFTIKLR